MNRLAYGDVKHVIIAKLDRLGRNVRAARSVIDAFKAMGVALHITDMGGESLSTHGPVGHLILTILLAVAQWEVEEIRDRVTKQLRQPALHPAGASALWLGIIARSILCTAFFAVDRQGRGKAAPLPASLEYP